MNEVDKFDSQAYNWWNMDGEFKTLHQINPIRLQFVQKYTSLNNKNLIDVGCGGGIFSESLARCGARVTGIDLGRATIEVAKLHLFESNLAINYECIDIQSKADSSPEHFDVLTCMEMLEHVDNPEDIIKSCAQLLKNNGLAFFSTINRNPKSYTLSILFAEYILRLLPRGTHNYQKFIKPSELSDMLSKHNLEVVDIKGLKYNPLTSLASISSDVSVNYMVCCRKIV